MTPAEVAARLTEAQRAALIACVDALDELAGEGFCVAEDAIFELFSALGIIYLTKQGLPRRGVA